MTFFDRVREKLNHDRGRNDRIQRIFASDTKIAFAGVEVLAEDLAAVKEIAENIWQMQQVLTARVDGLMDRLAGAAPIAQEKETLPDRPVLSAGVSLEAGTVAPTAVYGAGCSACRLIFKEDQLITTKTGQWCPECYAKKFPGAAARRAK